MICKHVHFDEVVIYHMMYTWTFAYRESRKSDWKICAADRIRFQDRILHLKPLLSCILHADHRRNIYTGMAK